MLRSMQKNGHFMHHSVNWSWRFGERFGCVYDHLKICVLCVTVHILGLILVTCPRTLIYVCKCIKEDQRVRKKFSFWWLLLQKRVRVGQEGSIGTFTFY